MSWPLSSPCAPHCRIESSGDPATAAALRLAHGAAFVLVCAQLPPVDGLAWAAIALWFSLRRGLEQADSRLGLYCDGAGRWTLSRDGNPARAIEPLGESLVSRFGLFLTYRGDDGRVRSLWRSRQALDDENYRRLRQRLGAS